MTYKCNWLNWNRGGIIINLESEAARRQLHEILSDPEFNRNRSNSSQEMDGSWVEKLAQSLDTFQWGWVGWMLLGMIVVGGLVGIAVFFFQKHRRIQRSQDSPWQDTINHPDWQRAEQSAANQDFQAALKYCFSFLLYSFISTKRFIYAKSKTNQDYGREFARSPSENKTLFIDLATRFDEVVYGKREVSEVEYTKYREQVLQLVDKEGRDEKG